MRYYKQRLPTSLIVRKTWWHRKHTKSQLTALKILNKLVSLNFHEPLSIRKLFLNWVPRFLVVDQKQEVTVGNNGRNLDLPVYFKVTSVVGWVDSSRRISSKAAKNAIFWDADEILFFDYFETCQTIISDHYWCI